MGPYNTFLNIINFIVWQLSYNQVCRHFLLYSYKKCTWKYFNIYFCVKSPCDSVAQTLLPYPTQRLIMWIWFPRENKTEDCVQFRRSVPTVSKLNGIECLKTKFSKLILVYAEIIVNCVNSENLQVSIVNLRFYMNNLFHTLLYNYKQIIKCH